MADGQSSKAYKITKKKRRSKFLAEDWEVRNVLAEAEIVARWSHNPFYIS